MTIALPIVDFSRYLANQTGADEDCLRVARALQELGVVIVRDWRLPDGLNDEYHQMMVRYFSQPEELKRRDERLKFGHQIGWTPSFTEAPKLFKYPALYDELISKLAPEHRPPRPEGKDPKERWFTPIGTQPSQTKYPWLNEPPIIPEGFPEWQTLTNVWGKHMYQAILTTCEMAAIGFGANHDIFTRRMTYGPHLLAPTGSDLIKYGRPGTVLAGIHNDLNFMSGHGQANFPGLVAWTKDGQRFAVTVPAGCLLMQAGQQMERKTGGVVRAGYHGVMVTKKMQQIIEQAIREGWPLWRVTLTLFAHISSDEILEPVGPFINDAACRLYPPIEAGQQVANEIRMLDLAD